VSINFSSGAASGLAEPTGTGTVVETPGTVNNIESLFLAFVEFTALIMDARDTT